MGIVELSCPNSFVFVDESATPTFQQAIIDLSVEGQDGSLDHLKSDQD